MPFYPEAYEESMLYWRKHAWIRDQIHEKSLDEEGSRELSPGLSYGEEGTGKDHIT